MGSTIRRYGTLSWYLLGVIGVIVVLSIALGAVRGIAIPLIVAVILGTVLDPVVEFLEKRTVKPALAAAIALLVTLAAIAGTLTIVIMGFIEQLPEIYRQTMSGWYSFLDWGRTLDLDTVLMERVRIQIMELAPNLSQGLFGAITTTFSGLLSFVMGTFFALFLLFFVLRDARNFPSWLAQTCSFDSELTNDIADVAKQSLRGYFKGTAVTALVTAPIFIIPLFLLGIPLILPIFIMYFLLSFIPYLGAWITGVFAVLIAFGTGGADAALIIGLTFIVSNGTIQSVVSSWALGSSLKIHPVAVLLATLVGGTVAGLIGMILGAPLVAATTKSFAVARERKASLAASDGLSGDSAERS
ncbi:MAG: AI-2E family transporter [Actinomycetales bacterium]|nr:AI-2E family transporter [Actinomycetales bacterium]